MMSLVTAKDDSNFVVFSIFNFSFYFYATISPKFSHHINNNSKYRSTHSLYNDHLTPWFASAHFLASSFLFLRAGFCGVLFAPSDAGDEWILANLQDGGWKKDIPAHAGITRRRWRCRGEGLGRKKKRQHERSGVHGNRREREKCLPTTSAFRMIDRSRCSSGRWSLMISIGWEPDPLLTLSSITSFPRAFSTFVRLETRYGKCRENRQIREEESATFENYVKLFQKIILP